MIVSCIQDGRRYATLLTNLTFKPLDQSLLITHFAFPHDDQLPPRRTDRSLVFFVTVDITFELRQPELLPCFRSISLIAPKMTVPKTSMHKHDRSPSGQDDIRATGKSANMEPKTKTHPMKDRSNPYLGLGVLCPDLRHVPASPFLGNSICHVYITLQVYFSRSWRSAEPVMGGPRCLPVGTALSGAPEIRSYQETSEVGLPHELSVSCTGGSQGE